MSIMLACTYVPSAPLSGLIELFWYQGTSAAAHPQARVLPEGTVELVIDLLREAHGVLIGARASHFVIDTARPTIMLGVHFKPGGIASFLPFPADELEDLRLCLDDVWDDEACRLREHLLASSTLKARFRLLERFLLGRLKLARVRHPAVRYALAMLEDVAHDRSISMVTNNIGLSARQFSKLFRQDVGLTPKRYQRVRRFQAALRQITQPQERNWVDIALACGYYDQAHFVNDFKAMSGVSPNAYLAAWAGKFNHIPILE